jgi:predicted Fe-S protein YdhL (DUF1289 family)
MTDCTFPRCACTNPATCSQPRTRPDSPCIAICDTLYSDICTGCGRHFTEVAQWTGFTQEQKDVVWARIEKEMTAKRFTTYKERAN